MLRGQGFQKSKGIPTNLDDSFLHRPLVCLERFSEKFPDLMVKQVSQYNNYTYIDNLENISSIDVFFGRGEQIIWLRKQIIITSLA